MARGSKNHVGRKKYHTLKKRGWMARGYVRRTWSDALDHGDSTREKLKRELRREVDEYIR